MTKIGKRKKLQIARRLPRIEEEEETHDDAVCNNTIEINRPFENCVNEIYEKYNDEENFPLFCYLEKEHLRDFLNFTFTR